jgi:NADPH:quinone reductase-like Zn-dependent oxidoreductase
MEYMRRVVELTGGLGDKAFRVAPRTLIGPEDCQIRIKTQTAGVAFGDLFLREGLVRRDVRGLVPGYDAVGTIDALGAQVGGLTEGDRMAVWTNGMGGYATHVTVDATLAVPVPAAVDAATATALILNYVTAWQMLTRVAPVGAGGTILVHGASGAVGGAVAELAQLRGVTVLGTASLSRAPLLHSRGIEPLDRAGDWARDARRLVPGGLDAVIDSIGGRVTRQSMQLLGPGGHLVVSGFSSSLKNGRRNIPGLVGAVLKAPRPLALTLFRRGTGIHGYASTEFIPARPDWFREDLAILFDLSASGSITPRIAEQFPLERAAQAQALLARGVDGKIVLTVDADPA